MKTLCLRAAKTFLFLAALIISPSGSSQYAHFDYSSYPPIHHPVPFHAQRTMVWCWVAAAKMVAEYVGRRPVPSQCEMLQLQYGAPCCANPALCSRPGHISEIQGLIATFGGRYSRVSPPADGFALYHALRRGPLVLHTSQGAGHFVVATGMRVSRTPYGPLGVVSINDPLYGRYEIDFPRLRQAWTAAVVVH
jgi:Papain-like cysteine protease AvrRpt2